MKCPPYTASLTFTNTHHTRNYRNYSASMSKTAFNMAGLSSPHLSRKCCYPMMQMGLTIDSCSPSHRRDVLLNDLKFPIPSNVPSLRSIYTLIRMVHKMQQEYTMDTDALEAFQRYHDDLVHRQSRQVNDNIQEILSKARGYVA